MNVFLLNVCHVLYCRDTHDSNVPSRAMSYSLKILVFRVKANVTMILLEKNTSTASTFSSGNLGATRGSGVAIPSLLVALPTTILCWN